MQVSSAPPVCTPLNDAWHVAARSALTTALLSMQNMLQQLRHHAYQQQTLHVLLLLHPRGHRKRLNRRRVAAQHETSKACHHARVPSLCLHRCSVQLCTPSMAATSALTSAITHAIVKRYGEVQVQAHIVSQADEESVGAR